MPRLFDTERFKFIDLSAETPSIRRTLDKLYTVSTKGRVRRVKDNKILPTYISKSGYEKVSLKGRDNRKYSCYVHHLVADAFLFNPDREKYTVINHKDENKTNNNIKNLEWCTSTYNLQYSSYHRRTLTPEDILAIDFYLCVWQIAEPDEKLYKNELGLKSPDDLIAQYGISRSTLYKIRNKKGYYGYILYQNALKTTFNDEFIKKHKKEIEIIYKDGIGWLSGVIPFKEI